MIKAKKKCNCEVCCKGLNEDEIHELDRMILCCDCYDEEEDLHHGDFCLTRENTFPYMVTALTVLEEDSIFTEAEKKKQDGFQGSFFRFLNISCILLLFYRQDISSRFHLFY
ncbi:MAG: hypothetical protein JSV05_05555 [Candidatus Bathyarchaeota archaeon]|nr:MAG: hypothetical protein JSV05_05555 [Candidatus Bathyarchaeota archaeon]